MDRMEINRGGRGYSVQGGLDMDLVVEAMTNAEAIAEEHCGATLLLCQIDELADGTGLRLDARNVGGSAFIAQWPYDSSEIQVQALPAMDLDLPPEVPPEEY